MSDSTAPSRIRRTAKAAAKWWKPIATAAIALSVAAIGYATAAIEKKTRELEAGDTDVVQLQETVNLLLRAVKDLQENDRRKDEYMAFLLREIRDQQQQVSSLARRVDQPVAGVAGVSPVALITAEPVPVAIHPTAQLALPDHVDSTEVSPEQVQEYRAGRAERVK